MSGRGDFGEASWADLDDGIPERAPSYMQAVTGQAQEPQATAHVVSAESDPVGAATSTHTSKSEPTFTPLVDTKSVREDNDGADRHLLDVDDIDDVVEVLGQGVAGGEEGEFAAVEDRGVGKVEVVGGDADVDHATGEGGVVEAGGHGLRAAGGVDHDIGEMPVGEGLEFRQR